MSLFDQDDVADLVRAAIDAGLRDKRDGLLAHLPEMLKASLPERSTQAAQLKSDLEELNVLEQLPDDTIPALIWLKNARLLAGPREQSSTFSSAIAGITNNLRTAATPTPEARASATQFLASALDLLWSPLFHPDRWSAYVTNASRTLPADFSLSHLALRPRREAPVDRLCDRILVGAFLPPVLAIALPFILAWLKVSSIEHGDYLRHVLCVTALAVSAGAGMSVGGSVATGLAASTAGIFVGVVGVTLDMLAGNKSAHIGIGSAGGAALGAAAVVSLAVGRPPRTLLRGDRAGAAVIPLAVSGALVAMLCVLGFAVSQIRTLSQWYKDGDAGILFVVGGLAGVTLGAFISLKGWIRLRVLPSLDNRPSPLITWLGVPLVAGALLTWRTAGPGKDDWLPIRGLGIGLLTGAVVAAAFSVTYTVLAGKRDSMRASAWSAVGGTATSLLVLLGLNAFKHLVGAPFIAIGIALGFVITALVIAVAQRLKAQRQKDPLPG